MSVEKTLGGVSDSILAMAEASLVVRELNRELDSIAASMSTFRARKPKDGDPAILDFVETIIERLAKVRRDALQNLMALNIPNDTIATVLQIPPERLQGMIEEIRKSHN